MVENVLRVYIFICILQILVYLIPDTGCFGGTPSGGAGRSMPAPRTTGWYTAWLLGEEERVGEELDGVATVVNRLFLW